jgi:uncharacterized membrane protein|tara:strand:- start:842 stop:994 length:153 start_codon:yes stop_codon:yes gene_type:complete
MESFMDFWPVISGLIAVAAIGVAFRAEITVRVKILEDKVKTLFDMMNRMK